MLTATPANLSPACEMEQPSKLPQQLRVTQLGGVNERVSPSQLRPGEFSHLEGLYPSANGLLSRVPGKQLLATLPGGTNVLKITQTFNSKGDILVHTDSGRFVYTLDELYGRQTIPNLTPGTVPGGNDNEEAMSIAIIYQEEANAVPGGSAQGFISGTDTTGAANTFYGRRLTNNPTNQSSTLVSFTASTGGGGAVSTPGQFVLSPATYRIRAWFLFGLPGSSSGGITVGLYNNTLAQFQLEDGTGTTSAHPIIGSAEIINVPGTVFANTAAHFSGRFIVTGSNNTFQIMQAGATTGQARDKTFGGNASGLTSANVNAAAALQRYGMIEILKEP